MQHGCCSPPLGTIANHCSWPAAHPCGANMGTSSFEALDHTTTALWTLLLKPNNPGPRPHRVITDLKPLAKLRRPECFLSLVLLVPGSTSST
ncbi:hypothetical protein ACFX2B_024443 [Malus domestica]